MRGHGRGASRPVCFVSSGKSSLITNIPVQLASRPACSVSQQARSSAAESRFPERELLDRLRKYEDLLTQHNIKFEPLHPHDPRSNAAVQKESPDSHVEASYDSDGEPGTSTVAVLSPAATITLERPRVREAKRMLHTMNQEFRDRTDGDSSDDEIFQLWQLYLDNVDPLLKVTHTPSLQKRMIEAATNVLTIKPELEALMFGIYCMAITSLTEDGCRAMFTSSRVSVRPTTTPQSLSSMLSIVIRIGQRMGIHSEAILAKSSALEAEMSRRLWWSLILFDTRIGEMADLHATSLLPTRDCRVPLTVNDSDLREEMKESPQVQGKLTDVLFAVCRSELANFVRHTKFHLGFFGPSLRPIETKARRGTEGAEMDSFAKTIEDKCLKFCNPDNALHFMTIWTTRGNLAKYRLVEHHFRYSGSSLHQAETQRDAALSYALRMLECNTKLIASPLTKGFIWMVHSYFPFIGYIQIIQHLKWRPMSAQAPDAWEVMNDNYQALLEILSITKSFFKLLTNMILQAWEARKVAYRQSGELPETPQLVLSIRQSLGLLTPGAGSHGAGQSCPAVDIGFPDYPTYYDLDMDHLDWSAMDWDLGHSETGAFKHEEQQVTNALR